MLFSFLKKKNNNQNNDSPTITVGGKEVNVKQVLKEGFVFQVHEPYNPQRYADVNIDMHSHNNKLIAKICAFLAMIVIIFNVIMVFEFINIPEHDFYTTSPSGMVYKLETSTDPTDLHVIKNEEQIKKESREFLIQNAGKVKWFSENDKTKVGNK